MRKITCIPATKPIFHSFEQVQTLKRRVAAYARVSTDSDEQFTSFEAQKRYYTEYIENNPEWVFAGIYADEGISGTNTAHRHGFTQMIKDALAGKFDLIITKSLSRFARNTVDSLETVRKLREKNVEVYFEKERLFTLDPKNEFLLTIFSSIAQEESRSISENVTWGKRQSAANGNYSMPYKQFLGYKKGADGTPEIIEEEAEIVRLIYREYLEGKTSTAIATHLTEMGVPTPSGKKVWIASTIISILTNEKYKGDAQLQKTYVVDYLTKKHKVNEGEIPAYYVENGHPAIVTREVFNMVQVEMDRRRGIGKRYSCASIFSSKLICADCGFYYGSKVWHPNSPYQKTVWQCNNKYKGAEQCGTPKLEIDQIKKAFVNAYNLLFKDMATVVEGSEFIIKTLTDCTELEKEDSDALAEMEISRSLAEKLIAENSAVAQNQETYRVKFDALSSRHEKAVATHKRIQATIKERTAKAASIQAFLETLKQRDGLLEEFDEATWTGIVEKVMVHKDGTLDFVFNNGTKITVDSHI